MRARFAKDFLISDFDEDFRGADLHEQPCRSIEELLGGCSYGKSVIPKFASLVGGELPEDTNVKVMLYNFKYDGRVTSKQDGPVGLRYIGNVEWE